MSIIQIPSVYVNLGVLFEISQFGEWAMVELEMNLNHLVHFSAIRPLFGFKIDTFLHYKK